MWPSVGTTDGPTVLSDRGGSISCAQKSLQLPDLYYHCTLGPMPTTCTIGTMGKMYALGASGENCHSAIAWFWSQYREAVSNRCVRRIWVDRLLPTAVTLLCAFR